MAVLYGTDGFLRADFVVKIGDKAFKPAYRDRLALDTAHAFFFALGFLRTNAAAYRREGG
ncbi:hypothetical protein SDC9_130231 [bioreactor metagenome]|uniref:Uncharacterized protein n=1 Tax=bioreactor metagenome TaxID=1076179 RepID=A0A645D282_9ZZZZ